MVRFNGFMDGRMMFGLALTSVEVAALWEGKQIIVPLEEMEGPQISVLLLYGKDQEEASAKILELSNLPPDQVFESEPDGIRVKYTPVREG